MPPNRLKLLIVPFVLMWILACGVNSGGIPPDTRERNRMLSIVFDESQREVLFARLQDFARNHNYEWHTTIMEAEYALDVSALRGDDKIEVLVATLTLDYKVSPRPTMIYFMGGNAENPSDEETRMKIDAQVSDLMDLISDIPNIKITDVSCKDKADKDWQRCLRAAFR